MHGRRGKKHYSARERENLRRKQEQERELRAAPQWHQIKGLRRPPERPRPAVARPLTDTRRRDFDELAAALPDDCRHEIRGPFRRLHTVVLRHRPGLLDPPYLNGVVSLALATWHEDPETWRPRGKGLSSAFRSLVIHLLQSYPLSPHLWDLPLFTNGFDLEPRQRAMQFLTHLAFGSSPRLLHRGILPAPLTRRMLHLLTNPPYPMPYESMVRRAQVLGHGGREQLAACLASTRLARFQPREDYWHDFIHWCCRQDDLDLESVGPLVDFLHDRVEAGEPLALAGRTHASLCRLMRAWHRELANRRAQASEVYTPSGLAAGVWVTARHEDGAPGAGARWEVREILTGTDLIREGRAMGHCVASYGGAIAGRRASIWSLTCNGQRRVTIEAAAGSREIRQVRGKANRIPKPIEARIVERWALKNKLEIRCWAMNRALGRGKG
ncbi:MAG: PcfJ domain-containing protein [bacterium]|nr:PcfJ domain-containing protein [bacterium]